MKTDFPLFWIPLFPLLGAAFNLLVGRKLSRATVHMVAQGTVLASLGMVISAVFFKLYPMWQVAHAQAGEGLMATPALVNTAFDWIVAGSANIQMGFILDPLSAVMVITITFVGFLIHMYSTGYMAHDEDYARFFGYLNLFTGSMLILVLGDNLLVLFVGWEGVGLCSYLLIGFWYNKEGTAKGGDANASAGRKAFITNRVGDFAFVLGMFIIFYYLGTLNVEEIADKAHLLTRSWSPLWGMFGVVSVAGVVGVLLLVGATGKSAQIPLFVWLPDAMAGPTPVSALIHAATMVTAGVYMVARLNFIYMLSPAAMGLVALVGACTALFAATIGLAQNDIKKVLAYSTISQLGYMFIGVGVGAFSAGVFHLFTHAFFKACLFLGAGAVIHAMSGKQDIREMGGLKSVMPKTHITFLISCLAIAGVPFFSGFFSKDEILWKAVTTVNPAWPAWFPYLIYVLGLAGAICTAFYMFRLYYLTFGGECRADEETKHHLHEQPLSMTVPLMVLAAGAAVLGFLGLPGVLGAHANVFHNWLSPVVDRGQVMMAGMKGAAAVHPGHMAHNHGAEWGLMALSVCVALCGIFIARKFYSNGPSASMESLVKGWPRLHSLIYDKYRIDELYHALIIHPLKWWSMVLWKAVDAFFIDFVAVNGTGWVARTVGGVARRFQGGNLQGYLVGLVAGIAVLIFFSTYPPDRFTITPDQEVTVGQDVKFDASPVRSSPRRLEYRWDFDGDGKWDTEWLKKPTASHSYSEARAYEVVLNVKDLQWNTSATESLTLEVQ